MNCAPYHTHMVVGAKASKDLVNELMDRGGDRVRFVLFRIHTSLTHE